MFSEKNNVKELFLYLNYLFELHLIIEWIQLSSVNCSKINKKRMQILRLIFLITIACKQKRQLLLE